MLPGASLITVIEMSHYSVEVPQNFDTKVLMMTFLK